MEQRIRDRYSDEILAEARTRYAIDAERIAALDGFESYIYEFNRADGDYILRIGHSLRRSEELIHGEVDWINYLAAGGAGVAQAVPSVAGRLVETIDDGAGGAFLATAFVRAPGAQSGRVEWTPAFVEEYGRTIGRLHRLSRSYRLADPAWRRPAWDDESNESVAFLPATDRVASETFRQTIAHLQRLPQTPDAYGMIHQDAHGGNFFVDDRGRLTLFDFDDCCYGHFIYDVAMVIFYAATNTDDPSAYARQFFPPFWRGYRQENELNPVWLNEIPWFLKLREIDLYAVIHRSYGADNIADSWAAQFMRDRKEKIDDAVPYLDVDFLSLHAGNN